MSGELYKGFGENHIVTDAAANQALQFIDTVAFDLQLDYDAKAIEHRTIQEQKEYEFQINNDADTITYLLNAIIRKFTRRYAYEDKGFDATFDTPEAWLMYRRHYATLQPDTETCKNYGLTIAMNTHIIEKKRRAITSAILSQSPIYSNGQVLYDTIGAIDHTSGIAWCKMTEKGKGLKYIEYGYAKESARKKQIEVSSPNRLHIVRFQTTERLYKEVQVPSKHEIAAIYDPSNKQFKFDPTIFTNYSNPIEVKNMYEISRIHPDTFKEHPDFFANLVAYLSSCIKFNETELEQTLKEISTILEKYQDT